MRNQTRLNRTEKLTLAQKNADDKAWYKKRCDELDVQHSNTSIGNNGISRYRRMKVNYELFNNILDLKDFEYVCKPYGSEVGELPAKMVNRDICSGKIKAMLGMESKRPFTWNVIATNPEATTRKEQEEYGRIRDWVISEIMSPIRNDIELQYAQQQQGNLTPEDEQKIQQQIAEELQTQTPDEVKKYMQRKHQDPAEVMSQQLLQYLLQKTNAKEKFNTAYKHLLLSATGILYVGTFNGEPDLWNVNSMRFSYTRSPELENIEDAEAASCEYRLSPADAVRLFGDELTDKQIDDLYNGYNTTSFYDDVERWLGDDSDTSQFFHMREDVRNTIRVLHTVWKSLRKIGFLTYIDDEGNIQKTMVDEKYKINKDQGDIKIEWEWFPEVYETWKINNDIYVKMQPIPGQFKDIDNLKYCKLPYYGVICDNMNAEETSLMDRLKVYQYYYNIVMYRLELLIASDKGKKVLMNINAIPDTKEFDMKKWQYFFESTPFMYYNIDQEGTSYNDANTVAKVIDLSVVSDIQKYIEIAEYLRTQAGRSVGITDAVEGQIGPTDAVSNTRQNLVQSSHILEWYFDMHSRTKRNVLQALLETAKVAYSNSDKKKLSYFLDDMSQRIINLDMGLLNDSTVGVFVTDSSTSEETKDTIKQLAHAAMQTQSASLSDVISILRQNDIVEMSETLKVAEQDKIEQQQRSNRETLQAQADEAEKAREFIREQHEMQKEIVILKESERIKTEVEKAALTGMSFNPDSDNDGDGINDFFEIAKHGLDAEIKRNKQDLEERQFAHQVTNDREKNKLAKEKLANEKQKIKTSSNNNS